VTCYAGNRLNEAQSIELNWLTKILNNAIIVNI